MLSVKKDLCLVVFLFLGLLAFKIGQRFSPHGDSFALCFVILSSFAWCRTCEPSLKNIIGILLYWISFAWILRDYEVGVSTPPGGIVQDLKYIADHGVHDHHFPRVFSNIYVYVTCLVAIPLFSLLTLIFGKLLWRACAWVLVVLSFVAMIHQYGMGNQMATTTFWAGLFMIWILGIQELGEEKANQVALISQMIVSFVFFGAVVGKLTPEYWSNHVTSHFGSSPNSWGRFGQESMGQMAIMGEGAIVLALLLVPKYGSIASLLLMCGMFVTVAPTIVDAVGPLVGLSMLTQMLVRRGATDGGLLARAEAP